MNPSNAAGTSACVERGPGAYDRFGGRIDLRPTPYDPHENRTVAALDFLRFDEIAGLADRAASYWRSIAEAAERGEHLTIVRHCRQASAVTCEAFELVRALGSAEVRG